MVGVSIMHKKKKFADEPNFSIKKDLRPPNVKETGFVFTGYEISDDGNVMNHFLHYDQLYTIRHGLNSKFFKGLIDGKILGTTCELDPGELNITPDLPVATFICNGFIIK